MTRTELAAFLLGLALIAGGGWVVVQRLTAPTPVPPEVVAVEHALALPGLLGLVTLDVASLAEVERRLGDGGDAQTPADEEEQGSIARILSEAGLDPRRDLRWASAALLLGEGGELGYAVALLGEIDAAAFTRAIETSPLLEVERREGANGTWLRVVAQDAQTCEPSRPWGVQVTGSRILASDPRSLERLLARVGEPESDGRDLSRFRAWREGRLAAAALFVPQSLPAGITNPFVAMPAEAVRAELESFDALYLAVGTRWLPPSAVVSAMLEGSDAAGAEAVAARWRELLEGARERVERSDILSELHAGLDIEADGAELHASLRVDGDMARRLQELPGELMGMAIGGFAEGMNGLAGAREGEERIAQNVPVFAPSFDPEQLPAYDPQAAFAGAVDAVAGPFGVRIESLALPAAPMLAGPEISVQALAPRIPNLGDHPGRARLRVTSVRSAGGDELLRDEVCGAHRNGRAVAFESSFGELIEAGKAVRLRPGARVADVARLAGRISLRLPVRTRTLVVTDLEAGSVADAGSTRVELAGVEGSQVRYRIVGDAERVLALRALNARGEPLESNGSSAMGAAFGRGRSGSTHWAGEVESVEVVFAAEERLLDFPFEIATVRPGTDGEQVGANDLELVDYSRRRLARDFRTALERSFAAHEQPQAVARAGPFLVALERLWGFGGLMPRLQVHAPEIPNLEHSLSALELALEEIHLRDGRVRRESDPPDEEGIVTLAGPERARQWAEILSMGRPFDETGLRGDASLETGARVEVDDVASLRGQLILRLPRRITTLTLPDAELGSSASGAGVSVTLAGLGRDRFTLRAGGEGEKVLGVRAYNASGDELAIAQSRAVRDDAGWRGEFGVGGVVERIDIIVAGEIERVEYPFALEL